MSPHVPYAGLSERNRAFASEWRPELDPHVLRRATTAYLRAYEWITGPKTGQFQGTTFEDVLRAEGISYGPLYLAYERRAREALHETYPRRAVPL